MAHHLPPPLLPLLFGCLLLATACGGTGSSGPVGPGAGSGGDPGPGLGGRAFLSTAVSVDGADRPLVAGSRIRLGFDADRLSVNAGCNSMSAAVRVKGTRMTLRDGLSSTELACAEPLMVQDRWLADLLTAGGDLARRDDLLTLVSGGTRITLRDERSVVPDAPLAMTTWTLESVVDGQTAGSVPAGVAATLAFGSGLPKAFVDTGCNTGSAAVEIAASTIGFGPLTLTARGCGRRATSVQTAVVAVLQGRVGYQVRGRQLTLTKGTRSLVYRALQVPTS